MILRLVKKLKEAKDTISFFFEKPQEFNFLPGQYIYLTLNKLKFPDDRGETRHFTISASPTEKDICITTRIREKSGFKKTLSTLNPGETLEGRGPNGNFTFDPKIIEHVFLAGGIGITPFRSIIKYAVDNSLNNKFFVVYSNSDSEFVFKNELNEWSKNLNIKIYYLNTQTEGRLTEEKLKNLLKNWNINLNTPLFWAVGPNPFVDAVEKILENLNVSSDKILTEKFTGY